MITFLFLLPASMILGVLAMYGGRGRFAGNTHANQGLAGEQSASDDHAAGTPDVTDLTEYVDHIAGEFLEGHNHPTTYVEQYSPVASQGVHFQESLEGVVPGHESGFPVNNQSVNVTGDAAYADYTPDFDTLQEFLREHAGQESQEGVATDTSLHYNRFPVQYPEQHQRSANTQSDNRKGPPLYSPDQQNSTGRLSQDVPDRFGQTPQTSSHGHVLSGVSSHSHVYSLKRQWTGQSQEPHPYPHPHRQRHHLDSITQFDNPHGSRSSSSLSYSCSTHENSSQLVQTSIHGNRDQNQVYSGNSNTGPNFTSDSHQHQDSSGTGIPRFEHPPISTDGSRLTADRPTGGYPQTNPATTNTESQTSIPLGVFDSSGNRIPYESEEFHPVDDSILGSLFTRSCVATEDEENIKYTVCLTNSWSKLDLSIENQMLEMLEIGECELKFDKRNVFKTSLRRRGFEFICNLRDIRIIIGVSKTPVIVVGLAEIQFPGEGVIQSTGWVPITPACKSSSGDTCDALCGTIPLFSGSIGIVASENGRRKQLPKKDIPIRGLFEYLPNPNKKPEGKFDVLISNGNTNLLYRGVDSYSSSSLTYSVVLDEANRKLIVKSSEGHTKGISLVKCKELLSLEHLDNNLSSGTALKTVHASIITNRMMDDMLAVTSVNPDTNP